MQLTITSKEQCSVLCLLLVATAINVTPLTSRSPYDKEQITWQILSSKSANTFNYIIWKSHDFSPQFGLL